MTAADHVRAMIDGVDGSAFVPVRAAWLQELLVGCASTPPVPAVEVDLTCEEVGALLHRDASVVRGWCRSRALSGAYKLSGREWRVPRATLEAFQREQRRSCVRP